MTKTILIASIIAGIAIMLLLSTQQVYAPPSNSVFFSFHGSTTGGPPGDITMSGGGQWIKGAPASIKASGGFTDTLGKNGNWKALTLTNAVATCPPCDLITTTSPVQVVFTAQFNPAGGVPFLKDVTVASSDITTVIPGTQNFWIQGEGFGTAISNFKDRPNPPP